MLGNEETTLQETGNQFKFEVQFAKQQIIESASGRSRVVDVSPDFPKTEVPVILASGMGATPEVNKKIIETIWKGGRRVMSIANDRFGGEADRSEIGQEVEGEPLRKAQALLKVIEEKGVSQVDAIGHSEGALAVTLAASLKPERFRNIVFLDPAGMVGESSVAELTVRQIQENIEVAKRVKTDLEAKPAEAIASAEFNKHLAESKGRSFDELKGVAGTQIQDVIKSIHELGIGVSIIHGVDDKVFPMQKIQEVAGKNLLTTKSLYGMEQGELSIDGFYSVAGRHNEIQFQPQRYTEVVIEALDALDKKKKTGEPTLLPVKE